MNVVPRDFTLHALFNNPNEQFLIPSYQRRYAWKFPQQSALFRDIDMLLDNDGHLFGMLILHTGMYHGGINTVDVVDGQQRLTTTTILLKTMMDKFKELNFEFQANQIAQLLYCGDFTKRKKRKLVLGELDEPDMEFLFNNKLDKIKNQRILEAHNTFVYYLEKGVNNEGTAWLEKYYQKLLHTAKIIRLDVPEAKDAYKLFETINNRGLRLSATDILKNFILGHTAKIDDETLKRSKELWAELIINLDGINSDDFFRQYVSSIYTRKISKTKLIEEFKKYYFKNVKDVEKLGEYMYNYGISEEESMDDENSEIEPIEDVNDTFEQYDESNDRISVVEYLQQIVNASSCYNKIIFAGFSDKKINQLLHDLKFIKSFTSYIFLMHFLQFQNIERKDKLKVLKMIASLMLRRHVVGRSTAYNDDIFANLLRLDNEDENYLKNIKDSLIEDYPDDEEFEDRFAVHELKERVIDRARYILTEIEYHITGNTKELAISNTEDVHVEHIIPKTIDSKKSKKEFGDWMEYLPGNVVLEHKKRVNRIGNMTLFSGTLNIKVSNNPFLDKRKEYKNSNIQLTKDLGEYKFFKFHHLDERGKELAQIALKIWKL
tara:strand:- start:6279 stop:8090 length:1812 start_codon:yes stop_codon:yes gene_type:complete